MKKIVLFSASIAIGLLCLNGCGGSSTVKSSSSIKILETIPDIATPKWVNSDTEFWEEKGVYFYRGTSEGMTNLAAAKRSSAATAQTNIAEQVKNTVRVEFSQAMEAGAYEETSGEYLKNSFFSSVDNLTVSGVRITSSFVQSVAETTSSGERIYYRAYTLASLDKEDYKKLVQRAFSDTSAQVSANKSAKEIAAETEKRFWEAEAKKAE